MTFAVSELQEGIYQLSIDLPGEKVNKLSVATLEELERAIDDLRGKPIKALIVLSGKRDQFIAGADIKQFEAAFKDLALGQKIIETGQRVFNKIAALPFPVIAAIHGAALGGGCELALACSHRIATDHPKTLIGLPETTLGLIPGWGGTQRLPRLVGLKAALELIVSGKPVKALKAYKLGLVDKVAAPEFLVDTALEFAQTVNHCSKEKRLKKGVNYWLFESNPLGRALLFWRARRGIIKTTRGFYPAPLLALNVLKKTVNTPLHKGLEIEMKAFLSLDSSIANHLIALFFGQEALKKGGNLPKGSDIKEVGLLGAGTMGGGIAWVFSNKGLPTRIKDISWNAIGHATRVVHEIYAKLVAKQQLTGDEASLKWHSLTWALDYKGFDKLDLILETATEELDVKRRIYAEVEACSGALLASNTSSLKIADLARDLKHPDRFIGIHFFNPASKMPLVEIIPGPQTSQETVATAFEFVKKLGKVPLIVGDCNGFLVNRIFMAAALEALYLMQEGASMTQLDGALLDFGMPMGSCELADEVGIDVIYKVAKVMEQAYAPRMPVPPLLQALYEAHLLGKKSGAGFYRYHGKRKKLNLHAEAIIDSFEGKQTFSDRVIVERFMLAMINEASHCLEENVVSTPRHIDLALVLAIGFPPFRGGPLAYADTLGLPVVYQKLSVLPAPRFTPTQQIATLAANHQSFY